jgi:hypothetical protein
MIPSLEIQLDEEGKTFANSRKEKTLGDEANVFFFSQYFYGKC